MSGENPREIAVRVLGRRRDDRQFVEQLLEESLAGARLSAADRRLCQELVYGVVRWQATLDWLITRKTQGRTQKAGLQNLLRLGLYQLFWLERVPDHAAVHETVELARQGGFGPQSGFVNAVLRGYLREEEATRKTLELLKSEQPWLGYSHPEWLVRRWQDRWGAEHAARLMQWNNTAPETYVRVNTLKVEPGKLLEQWRDEGVDYDFVRRGWLEENLVFVLKSFPPLHQLGSFRQGLFYVQDPSTLLAARQLAPAPGESVLDLCAAPGGKLTYIAQLMRNEGNIAAHDTSPDRLQLLIENCQRLGVTCVRTECAGPSGSAQQRSQGWATSLLSNGLMQFDKILIDAPCSNTGVMRRRVDLRWRVAPEELNRLRQMQLGLLAQAVDLLKRGGTLVYSTCSLEREENEQVVNEFLEAHPGFALQSHRELTPIADGVDGAYVARIERRA